MDFKNKLKLNEINLIINKTDKEFIDEMNVQITNQFVEHFASKIEQKNILFLEDSLLNNENQSLFKYLLDSNNNLFVYLKKQNKFYDYHNNKIISNLSFKRINIDFVITNCLFFSFDGNYYISESLQKIIYSKNQAQIIVFALSIQLIDMEEIKKENNFSLITNNFVINN